MTLSVDRWLALAVLGDSVARRASGVARHFRGVSRDFLAPASALQAAFRVAALGAGLHRPAGWTRAANAAVDAGLGAPTHPRLWPAGLVYPALRSIGAARAMPGHALGSGPAALGGLGSAPARASVRAAGVLVTRSAARRGPAEEGMIGAAARSPAPITAARIHSGMPPGRWAAASLPQRALRALGARLASPSRFGNKLVARTKLATSAGFAQHQSLATPGTNRTAIPGFEQTVRPPERASGTGDVYLDKTLVGYHLAAAITSEQTRAAARPNISGASFNSSMAVLRPSGAAL